MKTDFIKGGLLMALFIGTIGCSDGDDGKIHLEGSWISDYVAESDWNLYTFGRDMTVSYKNESGVEFQGTYLYDSSSEQVTINVQNTSDENYAGSHSFAVQEVEGKLLFRYGEDDVQVLSKLTPIDWIDGEWRWRDGDMWMKYVFKSNGQFDLIDEKGNQSRGTYTYHKKDKLLITTTTYAESGALGNTMFFVDSYKELLLLDESDGELMIFESIK